MAATGTSPPGRERMPVRRQRGAGHDQARLRPHRLSRRSHSAIGYLGVSTQRRRPAASCGPAGHFPRDSPSREVFRNRGPIIGRPIEKPAPLVHALAQHSGDAPRRHPRRGQKLLAADRPSFRYRDDVIKGCRYGVRPTRHAAPEIARGFINELHRFELRKPARPLRPRRVSEARAPQTRHRDP
jgi:hypothetical protein